ncbi:DUF4054 domain-containing protein [Xenorhabdus hominickii]|uniref:Phage related-protein n=1 Tax=Xenorhabdus hominickii TaxID=351679 RepID=A0A2G0Q2K1_XENHO|nr:DUF4054 domain-containing protein [Xenorhabdus hominickii]AOM39672.1 hypothetical protein A9255_03150 [Xenorhabdus hominickii]PHM53431.1 phage related-protein [Xenorhabdus hominickii]
MAIVTFDSDAFLELYPRFAGILTKGQLQQAFDVACLLLDNSDNSDIPYEPDGTQERKTLLYLLVCHIATVTLWGNNNQAGPASSATEGSVSVSFAVPDAANASWFKLTPCGQMYLQATRKYVVGGRYSAVKHYHPWG